MSAYIPVLKEILPYIAPLITYVVPYFTTETNKKSGEQSVQEKQITELQNQVTKNANAVKDLATQLQQTIKYFDERELNDQSRFEKNDEVVHSLFLQNELLKSALQKSIKDAQVTKYMALFSFFISIIAVIVAVF